RSAHRVRPTASRPAPGGYRRKGARPGRARPVAPRGRSKAGLPERHPPGTSVSLWHGVALTAWYVCEGPYSRTPLSGLRAYHRMIPPLAPRTRMPYPALIASVGAVVMRERAARWTLVLAATGFAAFTLLCTALTFLL